ncbi:MAG: DUF4263 domain-containing protein [Promicromonosporaceae bacterium]|nr:DUF4263 domain-containing protein [Promicromonosporaceae bacterium]
MATDFSSATSMTPDEEADYLRRRSPSQTVLSRTFEHSRRNSRDFGQPSKFASRVFDEYDDSTDAAAPNEGEEVLAFNVANTRIEIKALVSRAAGQITDLWVNRVPSRGPKKQVLHLRRDNVKEFLELADILRETDPTIDEGSVRIDRNMLHALMDDPDALSSFFGDNNAIRQAYLANPEEIRALLQSDVTAEDVVAWAARRETVDTFEQLLKDDDMFAESVKDRGGAEAVWQTFFERNPWILGIGLASQLLTSWDSDRLEQVVAGFHVGQAGKRADAVMKTAGIIGSIVFAEFKQHTARLLNANNYRSGIYAPSKELSGGVSQVQGTVHKAVVDLGHCLMGRDMEGYDDPDNMGYLYRPRAYLVIGSLGEFCNENGQHHQDKIRSFELYRRNIAEPEIITYDELLARARWVVETQAPSPNEWAE